jgi:class 3 adenylate cyclase
MALRPLTVPYLLGASSMDNTPSASGFSPTQRTLAAIVFTDVVGFSARMQRDEVGTVRLLQRDFAEMRRLCTEHEGSVLKTTGDGLLLTFASAVHAVACALAMQRQFAAEAKESPGGGALQHRIGIHLGDILVQNQDVMGDGVNIASRLQAEAEPGGICISQTVYDVVKNKLEMHVVSLGPRELKNISQAMPVYRILLEAQALGASGSRPPLSLGDLAAPRAAAAAAVTPAVASQRRLLISSGLVVALAAIAAGVLLLSRRPAQTQPAPPAPAPAASPAPAPIIPPVVAKAAVTPAPASVQAPSENSTGMTDAEFQREAARRKEAVQQLRTEFLDKYDFDGLVRVLSDKSNPASSRPGVQTLLNPAKQMLTMRNWLEFVLPLYSRQKPLLVHDLAGNAEKDAHVFTNPNKQLIFVVNGTPTPHEWADLKPVDLAAIIVSAIRDVRPLPGRDVFQGAQTFAQTYSLPAMRDAITAARSSRRQQGPQAQPGQQAPQDQAAEPMLHALP